MARTPNLEKMPFAELLALRDEIDEVIDARKNEEKVALRQQLADMAREKGFNLDEVVGRSVKRSAVDVKYRDPDNPENTWTGRGRMPRWMSALVKKRGVKKEDFLI